MMSINVYNLKEEYVIKKNEVDVRLILDGICGCAANPYPVGQDKASPVNGLNCINFCVGYFSMPSKLSIFNF